MQSQRKPALQEGFYHSLASGRVSHAYLVIGQRGQGKMGYAMDAAAALLCEAAAETGACAACPSCARVRAGSHPDLIVLRPQKTTLGVDDVRGLLRELSQAPFEGGRRVAIIPDADSMTPQAQNALLKSLEEPSRTTTFFLLASDADRVLPTVRSRCRIVRMRQRDDIQKMLIEQGMEREEAGEMAVLSGGAWGRAQELCHEPQLKEARAKALALLALRASADIPQAWQAIKDDKDRAQWVLLWLESWCADALRAQSGLAAHMAQGEALSGRFTSKGLRTIIEEIVRTRRRMGSNVAWQTAVEPLLLAITEGVCA